MNETFGLYDDKKCHSKDILNFLQYARDNYNIMLTEYRLSFKNTRGIVEFGVYDFLDFDNNSTHYFQHIAFLGALLLHMK